ncbi:MAG: AarF/ABC1/UbiB kinase family protein [Gammaproteobacteria bacterium]|nr:AarF/ABC1/UbiB kinase family protein [Gammaproteobacteria bacterium]
MNHKSIPTEKYKRSAISAITTAKIGLKHATYLGKKKLSSAENTELQDHQHAEEIGKILINALMQLRGTALKVAQMMSMELDMLPEPIRAELTKACSRVTPLNRAHIRKVYLTEFNKTPESVFKTFDSNAFAAASLGQVHRAISSEDEQLAVKIQYPGIAASIKSDVQLVRGIMKSISLGSAYLPRWEIIDEVLRGVQEQLEKEIDYRQEAENTQWFAEHMSLPDTRIPKVYAQFSGNKVLTTEFIAGEHLNEWLADNPSQTDRNHYGQILFDLFNYQLHELNVLHADPHPGNFLICDDGSIALIDFGCIQRLAPNYSKTIIRLFTRDPQKIHQAYIDLGIMNHDLSFEKFERDIFRLIEPMHTWMSSPCLVQKFDFSKLPAMPKNDLSQMKKAIKEINNVQQDQLYFDRSYFGLLSILKKIGAKINTEKFLKPTLN